MTGLGHSLTSPAQYSTTRLVMGAGQPMFIEMNILAHASRALPCRHQ